MEKFTSFLVMQHAKIINIYKYVYEHQNKKKTHKEYLYGE